MEAGLRKVEAGTQLGNSELLLDPRCSSSLPSVSSSHHVAHSSQPTQIKFSKVTKDELDPEI